MTERENAVDLEEESMPDEPKAGADAAEGVEGMADAGTPVEAACEDDAQAIDDVDDAGDAGEPADDVLDEEGDSLDSDGLAMEADEPSFAPAPPDAGPVGADVAGQAQAGGKGRHAKQGSRVSQDQLRSRKTRRTLIAVVVLLVLLVCGLVAAGFMLIQTTQEAVYQQEGGNSAITSDDDEDAATNDASTQAVKTTEVPVLTSLMGLTSEQAVAKLGHGATISNTREVNEEGNPVKSQQTILLTDEPADSKSGTPTVYLGMNEEGLVVMAGYSAPTSSLGYASMSFADAISSSYIVERTLTSAGLSVADGTVELPADSASYTTFDGDGETRVRESCSFSGTSSVGGVDYTWSSTLIYDYTAANASGNLADTVRSIYIYINQA